jgi:hypothetical protein
MTLGSKMLRCRKSDQGYQNLNTAVHHGCHSLSPYFCHVTAVSNIMLWEKTGEKPIELQIKKKTKMEVDRAYY